MPRFGSDANSLSQSIVGVTDEAGNALVETSVDFAASPLGVAARAQALFGIPNAQFNLTPPDTSAVLEDYENPLPYWSVENLSDGRLTAYSVFDNATSTWGVELDPSAGSASDSLTLKTRSYLLNDDNLSLRQKAFLTLAKSGTAAGTTQFNIVMTAEYFTTDDVSLTGGTAFAIGTALDTATFTTINGFTTAGTAAVGASAAYVDIKVTLTCSANVTGSAKATLKSMLLQTSTGGGGGGGQSFIISETFTSSTTWTRPTGVDYLLAIIGVGGGGGGGGGGLLNQDGGTASGTSVVSGGGSGAGGGFVYTPNNYIGDQTTISVGIGAGGAGGTARSVGATTGDRVTLLGGSGGAGGATTFGAYLTANGGGGGGGGSAREKSVVGVSGGAAGTIPAVGVSLISLAGTAVRTAGKEGAISSAGVGQNGVESNEVGRRNTIPYLSYAFGTASNGGTGSATGGTAGVAGTVTEANKLVSASGASGPGLANIGTAAPTIGIGGTALNPGGAGGAGAGRYFAASGTITVTAGNGGNAATASGGGGGGGGPAFRMASTNAVYTASAGSTTSGAGGDGAGGWVQIVYVA